MIGILSDAHGNYQAFNKAISLLKRSKAAKIIFLGDALGYFPNIEVLNSIKGGIHFANPKLALGYHLFIGY